MSFSRKQNKKYVSRPAQLDKKHTVTNCRDKHNDTPRFVLCLCVSYLGREKMGCWGGLELGDQHQTTLE